MPPTHLFVEERERLDASKRAVDTQGNYSTKVIKERAETTEWWQELWSNSAKGTWTRQLLPNVARQNSRLDLIAISFHLAQAFSGHSCFRHYIWRRNGLGVSRRKVAVCTMRHRRILRSIKFLIVFTGLITDPPSLSFSGDNRHWPTWKTSSAGLSSIGAYLRS